ncbi:MAG: AgmX/PglI C-terminal domain-containing protein [bacterium]
MNNTHELWEDSLPDEWLSLRSRFDRQTLRYIGLSAVSHLLLLAIIMSMPERAKALELDANFQDDRFVQMMFEPSQEPEVLRTEAPGEVADASSKHQGEEGKAGREDSQAVNKRLAIKGDNRPEDLQLRRMRDIEIAQTAGVAGVMNDQVASWFGSADTSIGSDAIHAVGNLEGAQAGDAMGNVGALGLHSTGRGGGGIKENSIGLADLATSGMKTGRKRGLCPTGDCTNMEREAKVPAEVSVGRNIDLDGGLDREIIKRVVRQHRSEVKDCYERELQKDRTLKGELVIKFTVSGKGDVISSVSQGGDLRNPTMEACINQRIRRWVFPEPKGGGLVIVKYPFRFSAGR